MQTLLTFALCGAAGAVAYSFPNYLKGILKTPPVRLALISFLFSVFLGSISAVLFTRFIGFHFPWTVKPEPWPLAMVVGLCSNRVVPVIIRKTEAWAESFEGKAR
jgi:drug/metabolite transporter (DMT)-like permease